MKRIVFISFLLLLIIVLAVSVTAEEEKSVYLSDNGSDDNSGETAAQAIKTFAKARELLGENGGIILIPDVYTYPASAPYYMGYTKGASYVFRGVTSDAKFVHARKNIAMQNPLTFDRITYVINSSNELATLFACGNRLEFSSTVTVIPRNNDATQRNNFLFLVGGEEKETKSTELILQGGTFGYIFCGAQNKTVTGNVTVTVGGNAHLLDRLYVGSSGDFGDILGQVTVNISGGQIDKEIYLGGTGETNYVTGNTTVTVTGGTFGKIYCHGSNNGKNEGRITVDVSGYALAQEENWGLTHILDRTALTTVVGEKPDSQDTSTEEGPTEQTPSETPPQDISTPENNTTDPTSDEPSNENPVNKTKGCKSVLTESWSVLLLILTAVVCLTKNNRIVTKKRLSKSER